MNKTVFLVISIFFLISCQKETKFEIQYPAGKLVVNCLINPNSLCKVYLTESLNPTDIINFKDVTGADIELFINGNSAVLFDTYIETFKNPGLGYYTNPDISVNVNDSLEIKVSHSNFESINAKTYIPEKPNVEVDILTYSVEEFTDSWLAEKGYDFNASIKLTIFDNKATETFYSVKMFYFADAVPYPHEGDTLYTDKIHFNINADNMIKTYKFNEGYIFSNENFTNGNDDYILLIEDGLYVKRPDFNKVYLEIKSISKDYYLYQKTMIEYYQAIDNPFSEPAKVYGNINKGYGIFAGYNSVIDTVFIDTNL